MSSPYYQNYLEASLRGDSAAAKRYWDLMQVEERNARHQREQLEQTKKQTDLLRRQAESMERQEREARWRADAAERQADRDRVYQSLAEQQARVEAAEAERHRREVEEVRQRREEMARQEAEWKRARRKEKEAADRALRDVVAEKFGKGILEGFVFAGQNEAKFDEIDLTPADGQTGFFFEPCPARRKAKWLNELDDEPRRELQDTPIESERVRLAALRWKAYVAELEERIARGAYVDKRTREIAAVALKMRRIDDAKALGISLEVLSRHEDDHAASVVEEDRYRSAMQTHKAKVAHARSWGSPKPAAPKRASTPTEDAQNARIGWAVFLSGACLFVHWAVAGFVACCFIGYIRQQSRFHARILAKLGERGSDPTSLVQMLDLSRPFREQAKAQAEAERAARKPAAATAPSPLAAAPPA